MKRIALLVFLSACRSAAPEASPPPAALPDPSAALDGMDARKPVPLLPMMAHHQKQNMRDHLEAVQEITAALARSDFEGVEKAAARIGFSEQMGQMCNHMGAAAPGFSEQALNFHRTADGIVTAAKARDAQATLQALGATLTTCTGCHAQWKQQVVDDATWSRLAQAPAPQMHH